MKKNNVSKKKNLYSVCAVVAVAVVIAGGWQWYQSRVPQSLVALRALATQHYVDFNTSMQTDNFAQLIQTQPGAAQLMSFFKDIYDANAFNKVAVNTDKMIPPILHHIWMGSPVRVQDVPLYHSWHTYHPQWTFIFWTDHESNFDKGDVLVRSFEELDQVLADNKGKPCKIVVDVRGLQFENRVYFDEAVNYGERGDILDYEIVYRYGGTYVDLDFECYRPLDLFHHTYDFFTGIQPLDTGRVQLGAALFGAIPHHPVMKSCVENIKHNRHIPQIIAKTGPLYFTREFYKVAGRTGHKDIAFPASYFYPMGYEDKQKMKAEWCKNESFATHHWAGSWLQPSGFVQPKVTT
jgi:inositol phosphorylceramide mannosyltransferase catalytic subunit